MIIGTSWQLSVCERQPDKQLEQKPFFTYCLKQHCHHLYLMLAADVGWEHLAHSHGFAVRVIHNKHRNHFFRAGFVLDSHHVETGRRQNQTVEPGCVKCDLRAVWDQPLLEWRTVKVFFLWIKLAFKFCVSMCFLLAVQVNEVTFTLYVKLNYSDYFQLCDFDSRAALNN